MPLSRIRLRPDLTLLAPIGVAAWVGSAHAVAPLPGATSALTQTPTSTSASTSESTSAPVSGPVPLPFKQDEDVMSGAAGVSILLLFVALVAVVWAANRGRATPRLRRLFGMRLAAGKPGTGIDVSGGTALNAAVKLHTVEWEGGRLLVAANAAGGVTVLQVCPGAVPTESARGEASAP
jgi:hypothetical protein